METETFEKAAVMHRDRVHAYAFTMLRNAEAARDIAQEALVRLWQNWEKVDGSMTRAWLMRTAHNLCIDQIRKAKVRNEESDDYKLTIQQDSAPDPARLAASGVLGQRISDSLASLTPEDRAVVVMREVQGLPYSEIASALDLPLGTLKARLHRARERLRAHLTQTGVTP
jgi:RNA polymerase sigma-70 factor (ECF subfamily)